MPRKKISWLLVGDGAKAQFYSINAIPLRIKRVPSGSFRGAKKAIKDDKPSVSFERVGGPHQKMERHSNAHRRHEDEFVGRVAAAVNAAAAERKFDDIIVVLPPRALAAFRKCVAPVTQKKIKQEIRSEWTKLRAPEIEKHLAARF